MTEERTAEQLTAEFEAIRIGIEAATNAVDGLNLVAAEAGRLHKAAFAVLVCRPDVLPLPGAGRLAETLETALPLFAERLACVPGEAEILIAGIVTLARLAEGEVSVLNAYLDAGTVDDALDLTVMFAGLAIAAFRNERITARGADRGQDADYARAVAVVKALRATAAGAPIQ